MREYIIRRLLLMVPTLFVITVVVFLTVRLIPGQVVEQMVMGHQREQSGQMEETLDVEALRHMLGLDVPMPIQYLRWVGGVFTRGDFGTSLWTREPVMKEIGRRLPLTFELGILAFLMAQVFAFPIGVYSAVRQDTIGDYIGRTWAIGNLATPNFWVATMIMVFCPLWFGWAPPPVYTRFGEDPAGHLAQFLIPAFLIGMDMSASTIRMLRTTLLEVLRQDYIRTAWSKGLKERVVVTRHAIRNAMLPVITMVMGQLPIIWGGTVIMEMIFGIPGMGRLFIDSIFKRDYAYVSGLNLLFSMFGLGLILLNDIAYAWLDPRIRYR